MRDWRETNAWYFGIFSAFIVLAIVGLVGGSFVVSVITSIITVSLFRFISGWLLSLLFKEEE